MALPVYCPRSNLVKAIIHHCMLKLLRCSLCPNLWTLKSYVFIIISSPTGISLTRKLSFTTWKHIMNWLKKTLSYTFPWLSTWRNRETRLGMSSSQYMKRGLSNDWLRLNLKIRRRKTYQKSKNPPCHCGSSSQAKILTRAVEFKSVTRYNKSNRLSSRRPKTVRIEAPLFKNT